MRARTKHRQGANSIKPTELTPGGAGTGSTQVSEPPPLPSPARKGQPAAPPAAPPRRPGPCLSSVCRRPGTLPAGSRTSNSSSRRKRRVTRRPAVSAACRLQLRAVPRSAHHIARAHSASSDSTAAVTPRNGAGADAGGASHGREGGGPTAFGLSPATVPGSPPASLAKDRRRE